MNEATNPEVPRGEELAKKYLRRLPDLIVVILIGYFVLKRMPALFQQYKTEGTPAPAFSIPTLADGMYDSRSNNHPLLLVFWATWCGPCTIELSRLNTLVFNGTVPRERILAISSFEERSLLEKTLQERGYVFPVGLDIDGQVAQAFNVQGTPTLVFLTKDRKIQRISTGLSPLLDFRIKQFAEEP
jgi:peroxiredoxin